MRASTVAFIWLMLALFALMYHVWAMVDGFKDLSSLKQFGINSIRLTLVRGSVRSEALRSIVQLLFFVVGFKAYLSADNRIYTTSQLFSVSLFVFAGVLILINAALDRKTRSRLMKDIAAESRQKNEILEYLIEERKQQDQVKAEAKETKETMENLITETQKVNESLESIKSHSEGVAEDLAVAKKAVEGVADDLAKSHERASAITGGESGAAADAAATSPIDSDPEKE